MIEPPLVEMLAGPTRRRVTTRSSGGRCIRGAPRAGLHGRDRVIPAAARRLAILALTLTLGTISAGALLGVATGGSARRGAAVGLYAVGALCTVVGVALAAGTRSSDSTPAETVSERTETSVVDRELAGVLIVLGVLLVVLGIAIDARAQLV